MRNHLEAGRMHDALRGHVLESLYRASHPDGVGPSAKRAAALRVDVVRFSR